MRAKRGAPAVAAAADPAAAPAPAPARRTPRPGCGRRARPHRSRFRPWQRRSPPRPDRPSRHGREAPRVRWPGRRTNPPAARAACRAAGPRRTARPTQPRPRPRQPHHRSPPPPCRRAEARRRQRHRVECEQSVAPMGRDIAGQRAGKEQIRERTPAIGEQGGVAAARAPPEISPSRASSRTSASHRQSGPAAQAPDAAAPPSRRPVPAARSRPTGSAAWRCRKGCGRNGHGAAADRAVRNPAHAGRPGGEPGSAGGSWPEGAFPRHHEQSYPALLRASTATVAPWLAARRTAGLPPALPRAAVAGGRCQRALVVRRACARPSG